MKKRMFAILLTAAMVMTSLSGCKSSDSGDSKKNDGCGRKYII